MSKPEDNYYWYDGLDQVTRHQRGVLNLSKAGINTPPAQNEVFTFDEMGNWLAYDTEVPVLNQTRDYNKANEPSHRTGGAERDKRNACAKGGKTRRRFCLQSGKKVYKSVFEFFAKILSFSDAIDDIKECYDNYRLGKTK